MEYFPLQFNAPTVIPPTERTRPVPSIILTGHGSMSRVQVAKPPLPKTVGDDQVEVEVRYCGLNFTDNYLRLGIIRNKNFPVIMGSECSGIVTAVGKNVTDLQVGQKVICLKMLGGLFRHVVHVERKYCFLMPDNMDLGHAVTLGLNFVVAYFILFELGWLDVTERVVVFIQSVAGSVGTAVFELARSLGNIEVIGTASASKHEALRAYGLDHVFRHDENYVQEVLRHYPEGVDLVINTNGGSDIEKCLKILKPAGCLILLGSNSSAIYPRTVLWGIVRPTWDCGTVSSAEIISRNYCVAGVNIGLWIEHHPEAVQDCLDTIYGLCLKGKITSCLHACLPFGQVANGLAKLCKRENFGKVMLWVVREAAVVDASPAAGPAPVDAQPGAAEEPKENPDPEVEKKDSAASAEPKVVESADPAQPGAAEEPKENPDPEVETEDSAASSEPKVVESADAEEPEKVAEGNDLV